MPLFSRLPVLLLAAAPLAQALAAPPAADAAREGLLLLPAPDLSRLALEDAKRTGGAYRYGIAVPVDLPALAPGSTAGGRWTAAPGGRLRWTRSLASPGARSLDLHFSQLQLPTGAELHLVGEGEGNRRVVRAAELAGNGEFHSPYVLGERVRIEVLVPAAQRDGVRLQLAAVTHGYRGLFEQDTLEKSGSCNVDVACPAGVGWEDQIDSVGHYTFSSGGSSYVCTGTLMANSAVTTTPYFLTANHCMSTQAVASTIVVYWNYQSATCRTPGSTASGTPLSRTLATHTQSGSTLIATNAASDFTLLRLSTDVPAGADAFYSGWDATGTIPTSSAGIHHPAGHEKRIAIDSEALQITGYLDGPGTTHWRVVDWNQGTTEGGSSGSGLWNQSRLLVGQLHGGSAACGNDLSDYYGRLSVSWTGGGTVATRLRDHLDPQGGNTSIPGYRTAGGGNVAPVANFTFVVNGLDVTFTDGSTDGDGSIASRSWNFGDGATSTAANPSHTYATAGTYDVRLSVTDNGGLTHAVTKSVTVAAAGAGLLFSNGFEGAPAGAQTYSNAADVPITDGATVESAIMVSGRAGNAPGDAQVSVQIVHTYQGDLQVDLVAPDGTLYNIHNRTGGSADNISVTLNFDLSSEPLNGNWRLRVFDGAGGDTGYIDSWSITF